MVFKILYERLCSSLLKAVVKWKLIFLCLIQTSSVQQRDCALAPSFSFSQPSVFHLTVLVTFHLHYLFILLVIFFSCLFLCLNSPAPMYLPVTSVLSIFLHMKPFDLTYIGRPTSFAYIKQERSRQHATGSVSINIFEYFALSAADEQEFPVYSCLICLITNA